MMHPDTHICLDCDFYCGTDFYADAHEEDNPGHEVVYVGDDE